MTSALLREEIDHKVTKTKQTLIKKKKLQCTEVYLETLRDGFSDRDYSKPNPDLKWLCMKILYWKYSLIQEEA